MSDLQFHVMGDKGFNFSKFNDFIKYLDKDKLHISSVVKEILFELLILKTKHDNCSNKYFEITIYENNKITGVYSEREGLKFEYSDRYNEYHVLIKNGESTIDIDICSDCIGKGQGSGFGFHQRLIILTITNLLYRMYENIEILESGEFDENWQETTAVNLEGEVRIICQRLSDYNFISDEIFNNMVELYDKQIKAVFKDYYGMEA